MFRPAAMLAAVLLGAGCATTGADKTPAWVVDPLSVRSAYPRSHFIAGFGVSASPDARDVMSRKQAERAALSDIASLVQVEIHDTIEDLDTSVERNGRLLTQSVRIQRTQRVVTGLLSGAEIKEVYFDPRALNWHALAVLDRAAAGRGAVEAIQRRLREGRAVLAAESGGPLARFLALRRLEGGVDDLEQLAMAVAMFAPPLLGSARSDIEAYKARLQLRLADAAPRATVRVVLEGDGLREGAEAFTAPLVRVLQDAGFRAGGDNAGGVLTVTVSCRDELQVGSARVYRCTAGARFSLLDGDAPLVEGAVPAGDKTASRAGDRAAARRRSLERLGVVLPPALESALEATHDGEERKESS